MLRSWLRSRQLRPWIVGLGLWVCALLLLVSCQQRPHGVDAGNQGRITLGTTAKIRTLDPADAYELFAGTLLYNLGDRLYTYKLGTTELQPQLATALPTVSRDGLTYTLPLRQGVVFHDGTPFNAAAMAFSLRRFIANGGQPAFLLADTVAKVETTGAYELTITLKQPFVGFPALLAFSGLCAVSPQAYTLGAGQFHPDQFIGTGPYRLAQYGNDSLRLEAFDQYWGEKPANPGVTIQSLSSSAILFNAFRTGAVDLAYQTLDVDQIRSLQQGGTEGKWQVIEGRGDGIYYLTLNLKSPPLDRQFVRQAIAAVIDRPLLQSRIFRGQIEPLYSLIPTTLDSYRPVFRDRYGDGNVPKAQALLTQAGYAPSHPLIVELWYRSNLTSNSLVANMLKAFVQQKMGGMMQIDLKSVESATAYQNLDKGVYPTFILDWTPDFLDADNYLYPFMDCAQGSVATGCEAGSSKGQGSFYYNPQVNQLLAQSRQQLDPQVRRQLLIQIQEILAAEVPFIPLWQSKEFLFAQSQVTGAHLEATQKVPFWTLHKAGEPALP
ncbi:peptide ABC transporter substrate-binding protein [Neosynechococcus sphagnicola sy1]|uniref:Peptide ABC transporter substrate-binding protein n=1 Tax=Neosynechococcus sphagnicola sy1 TaxID=1497020 RepID=A0A098TJA7_9CYAN|nr:ABC transporter substrate-binding protein [Neosynechococcus sphagnicola]KGF72166.1 peptide ABC transporter substrate-binding protein [Neosynechococcus sphagnicola sy1]